VAVAVLAIGLALPALAFSGLLDDLFGFSNHGTPVRHKALETLEALRVTSARPGSYVKLASRNGIAVYAADRKSQNKLCFYWGEAGNSNISGSCLAPGTFPSPSRPVWDMSSIYPPPIPALHYLLGVAADGVRSIQLLAGSDCHPVATVAVIDNVYIDVLKPLANEDYIVARDANGKMIWHTHALRGPKVPVCGFP
jgi:hypothetical protein